MTRRATYQHTTTIQVWPGGQSYTYRGDPEGDKNQRSIRTYQQHKASDAGPFQTVGAWRKGTPAEWAAIVREVRAARIAEREVYCCDSGLVTELLKLDGNISNMMRTHPLHDLASGFGIDEIRNLYADPSDWDAETCRAYLRDAGVEMDGCRCEGADSDTCLYHGDTEAVRNELQDAVRAYAQDHPAEVFEWWRVSQWLCDALHAIGEVTIDNGYGCWWGRCTTGQGFIMDGVLQRVADHLFAPADAAARAERLVVKP